MGMVISLRGVLERAAETLDAVDEGDRAFMLRELNKHLEMVRDDPKRVNEFFELYVRD